jgi:hypothetical protein
MLLHTCHNAASVWLEYAFVDSDDMPSVLRLVSVLGLILGTILVTFAARPVQDSSRLSAGNEAIP